MLDFERKVRIAHKHYKKVLERTVERITYSNLPLEFKCTLCEEEKPICELEFTLNNEADLIKRNARPLPEGHYCTSCHEMLRDEDAKDNSLEQPRIKAIRIKDIPVARLLLRSNIKYAAEFLRTEDSVHSLMEDEENLETITLPGSKIELHKYVDALIRKGEEKRAKSMTLERNMKVAISIQEHNSQKLAEYSPVNL